ncbi:MAG TPA: hypothetical protein VKQ29_02345 [Aliidongia sp.]|nr:hypothetical protein [Aliidongia sp.]
MKRFGITAPMGLLCGLLAVASASAAPAQPPSVTDWIAMTPQQRMALREETRSWSAADRATYWARFDDELKAMTPAQRQALQDQAGAEMRALAPAPPPEATTPAGKLPKAVALPPPGDLTGRPD